LSAERYGVIVSQVLIFPGIQKLSQFNTYLSSWLYCISLMKLVAVGFVYP